MQSEVVPVRLVPHRNGINSRYWGEDHSGELRVLADFTFFLRWLQHVLEHLVLYRISILRGECRFLHRVGHLQPICEIKPTFLLCYFPSPENI